MHAHWVYYYNVLMCKLLGLKVGGVQTAPPGKYLTKCYLKNPF